MTWQRVPRRSGSRPLAWRQLHLDVLCFPSNLDAVWRPVYEAASWKIPSIVAVRDPQPDTMIHGETGLCIASGDAVALADAIAYFHDRPQELKRMGEAAARLARENFDSRKSAARVVEVYRAVLARRDAAKGD